MAGMTNSDDEQYTDDRLEKPLTENNSNISQISDIKNINEGQSDDTAQKIDEATNSALAVARAFANGQLQNNDFDDQLDKYLSSAENVGREMINKIIAKPRILTNTETSRPRTMNASIEFSAEIEVSVILKAAIHIERRENIENNALYQNFIDEACDYTESKFSADFKNEYEEIYERNVENGEDCYSNTATYGSNECSYFGADLKNESEEYKKNVENKEDCYSTTATYGSDECSYFGDYDFEVNNTNRIAEITDGEHLITNKIDVNGNMDENKNDAQQANLKDNDTKRQTEPIKKISCPNASRSNELQRAKICLKQAKPCDKTKFQNKRTPKSMTFTNGRKREVERQNRDLLRNVNSQKPNYGMSLLKNKNPNQQCASSVDIRKRRQPKTGEKPSEMLTNTQLVKIKQNSTGPKEDENQFENIEQLTREISELSFDSSLLDQCNTDSGDTGDNLTYRISDSESTTDADDDVPFKSDGFSSPYSPYCAGGIPPKLKQNTTKTAKLNNRPNQKPRRTSWSFSNERMREIDRENRILLRKILTTPTSYGRNEKTDKIKRQTKFVGNPPSQKPTGGPVNCVQQPQIDLDKKLPKRKIQKNCGQGLPQ